MMNHWWDEAIFYAIYPLGLLGAPETNDFSSAPVPRLDGLRPWFAHARDMGFNSVYLGPVFESLSHGYDTADYFNVDRRLGECSTLASLVADAHSLGLCVVLDGVFNHVGRRFWALRDVQTRGQSSQYCEWFSGLRFDTRNRYGDAFTYDNWNGFDNLVKLNLSHPAVRAHLFQAVRQWIEDYAIDGLRLDAADSIDLGFQRDLAALCRSMRPDFWLMGEVVHGDYTRWANPDTLDSVTNYEAYKGLYSSHNDRNYFEIAWTFNRQFGAQGLYRGIGLYNFADNHDVDRVASLIDDPANLTPLYSLLFSMPGVPSIYYGSEFGLTGRKNGSDAPLRPALDLGNLTSRYKDGQLPQLIRRLAGLRRELRPLREGDYSQALVDHEQFAFSRRVDREWVLVAVNSAGQPASLDLPLPAECRGKIVDGLHDGDEFYPAGGRVRVTIPAHAARILSPAG